MKNPTESRKVEKPQKPVKQPKMNTKTISMKYVKLLLWLLMIPISMQNKDVYQLILGQTKIQLSNIKILRNGKRTVELCHPFFDGIFSRLIWMSFIKKLT
jgi:hypothetical protein